MCWLLARTTWAAGAADPNANAKTQATLQFLNGLPTGTTNRLIVGQHEYPSGYPDYVANIYSTTGKYVGLVGYDFYFENSSTYYSKMINCANANSLITVMPHFPNPDGSFPNPPKTVDMTALITNGTSANTTFKAQMDAVAAGLTTLQNNNVTVLFRPFHEMNGNWYWWSSYNASTAQYIAAWRYLFNYLTTTKVLHNLLWVWAPNATIDWAYYPGSSYVDVVAADVYNTQSLSGAIDGYSSLATNAPGKPFAIAEGGPCDPSAGCTSSVNVYPSSTSGLLYNIRTYMPKTTYFMEWGGSYALNGTYVTNAAGLLGDPWVMTRDEMPIITGGASDTNPPAAPTGLRVR